MTAPQLRVILDDDSSGIDYLGQIWKRVLSDRYYQGSSIYAASSGNGVFGAFNLTFEGTSIAFIGNCAPSGGSQFFIASIDNTKCNTTYLSPWSYLSWFKSPELSDGSHTITVDHLDQAALDMVLITVGPNTPVAGKTIFVDNDDAAIHYTGNWNEDTAPFVASTVPTGLPVGNTTQRSNTVGDTMTFRFTGTTVSIYGIFSWTNISVISATYTIDDNIQSQISYPVTANSPEHISALGEAANFPFFTTSVLAGDHTLLMNITDIQNTTFVLDYMTYSASFSSQATMPNLTIASATPSPTSFTDSSSPSSSPTSSQISSEGNQGNKDVNRIHTGAIIGGSIGGVVVVALLIAMVLYYLRGRNKLHAAAFQPSPFEGVQGTALHIQNNHKNL